MRKVLLALLITGVFIISISFFLGYEKNGFNVLVVHREGSDRYLATYQHFKQSLLIDLRTESSAVEELTRGRLKNYRLVYLEPEVFDSPAFVKKREYLMEYVENGGGLFLANTSLKGFPESFIGAGDVKETVVSPEGITYPEVKYNLQGLQEILREYRQNYSGYMGASSKRKKALGISASTAESLMDINGLSVCAVNRFGKGFVFFSAPALPDDDYVNGFDFKATDEKQSYFNYNSAAAGYLIKNEFAAFISKERSGYAVKKVLGTYGRPAMAWQNHFEVLSAIGDGSMKKWIDLLKKYNETPSYSLARSAYDWGIWKESVSYHINTGSGAIQEFTGEEENSHYSSGRHASAGNGYLQLRKYPEYKSLSWPIELPYRAYPSIADMDGDGVKDLVSGSSDGYVYFFKGKDSKSVMMFDEGIRLRIDDGSNVSTEGFSAPVLYDMDKDGRLDIIAGSAEGKVYLFRNISGLSFSKHEILFDSAGEMESLAPDIGDLNGDGTADLIFGDSKGFVYLLKGEVKEDRLGFGDPAKIASIDPADVKTGFAAPRLFDYNGDGKPDLYVGSGSGYIKKFANKFPSFTEDGFVEGETLNQFGEKSLWGGHNTVPCLADVNGDGKTDLLVGQLEFGMPVPIDAPEFPFRNELKDSIAYAEKNFIDIQPHIYVHSYKSPEQEDKELELHKKAFAAYGIDWDRTGANQHTWRVNNLNPVQTFISEMKSGIWWNSGFKPANNPLEPSLAREYAWSVPFLLAEGRDTKEMIIFNPAPNLPLYEDAYYAIARFDMPVSHFWHVEYDVKTTEGLKNINYKAAFLDRFRNDNDYNFMTESQMVKTFMAVMKSEVKLTLNPVEKILYSVQNRFRTKQQFGFYLKKETAGIPEPARDYANVAGVKIEAGERFEARRFMTDSDIYYRKGNDLYLAVGSRTNVHTGTGEDGPHIERANCPVEVSRIGNHFNIDIRGKGLQQLKFYAPNGIDVFSEGWEKSGDGGHFVLTRYGDATRLEVGMR